MLIYKENYSLINCLGYFNTDDKLAGSHEPCAFNKPYRHTTRQPSQMLVAMLDGGWFDYDLVHKITSEPMDDLKAAVVTHTLLKRR